MVLTCIHTGTAANTAVNVIILLVHTHDPKIIEVSLYTVIGNEEQWIKELREKRIAYGISQGRLAVASGITREYFNKIESGKMKPSKELQIGRAHV